MTDLSADVRRRLRQLRTDLGLTQGQLAERMHTVRTRVANLETADHDLQLRSVQAWAEALGATVRVVVQLGPKWHHLDERDLGGGRTVVYHWRRYPERWCTTSYEVIHVAHDRCRTHMARLQPCPAATRDPECRHERLAPELATPRCLICGRVGENVTDQVAERIPGGR